MNRNIVWEKDAIHARQVLPTTGRGPAAAPPAPEADGRAERLLKFIPGEAVGLYLFLDSAIKGAATPAQADGAAILSHGEARVWLAIVLLAALVFNWLYLQYIWHVQRAYQWLVSCAALLVYVFAAGGVFATFDWYKPFYGTVALAIAGAFLIFAPEPPGKPLNP
jgi:hypothetical protein